jgi:hypothetical protein
MIEISCKYGDEDCTVWNLTERQTDPCGVTCACTDGYGWEKQG